MMRSIICNDFYQTLLLSYSIEIMENSVFFFFLNHNKGMEREKIKTQKSMITDKLFSFLREIR